MILNLTPENVMGDRSYFLERDRTIISTIYLLPILVISLVIRGSIYF
ncbi:MAG: hypothetical protein WA865_01385 [Spirulinaceae cyanobacterium]